MNKLLLLAGSDIPFPEARVTIHQPTIKEIGYIGEDAFFYGCGFLDFSKNLLDSQDKKSFENFDDFDIFMAMMISNEKNIKFQKDSALAVLTLIFPLYEITLRSDGIILNKGDEAAAASINKTNFKAFKQILKDMFSLDTGSSTKEVYNPVGSMSSKIAEKLKKRHAQLAKIAKDTKGADKELSILNRYVSILSIGVQKSINDLMQYTVYQLYDEFQRFQLKMQWDTYISARMAGAKDLEEVDNWMIDLADQGKNKK